MALSTTDAVFDNLKASPYVGRVRALWRKLMMVQERRISTPGRRSVKATASQRGQMSLQALQPTTVISSISLFDIAMYISATRIRHTKAKARSSGCIVRRTVKLL